jgi:DNA-binding protein HU-beta
MLPDVELVEARIRRLKSTDRQVQDIDVGSGDSPYEPAPTTSEGAYDMGLTKTGLIEKVAERADLSKKDAGEAVEAVLWAIEGELKTGSDVNITGFGKFSVSDRAARQGVNPRTGDKMQIAAARVPRFTPGSKLKEVVNTTKK